MRSTMTEDYVHAWLPSTLQRPQVKGREAFLTYSKQLLDNFVVFNGYINEVIDSPTAVVFQTKVIGQALFDMEYENEHIWIFHIAEGVDGKLQITHVTEFVDSAAELKFFPALKAKIIAHASQK